MNGIRSTWLSRSRPYAAAVLAAAAAAAIRFPLQPVIGPSVPFLLFFASIAFSALYGGLLPGLLATVLAAVLSLYLFMEPVGSFQINSLDELVRLLLFLGVGAFISWLSENTRKSRRLAEELLAREQAARAEAEASREEKARLLASEERARREAEAASRAKDEFLSTLSHELRTPLNAMLGWVRMLQSGGLDAAQQARALQVIERNTKSQAQLIEDILDISRLITGRLRLDVQPVGLASIAETVLESLRPALDAKSLRVETILDPRADPVPGDPQRLQQIVWNLVSNAIKFTPKGGRIRVLLERINSHVELTVSDNGQGIDPQFLPYVFDRFRQADGSTTRRHGGLGLGLAIVRHLTELHGGTVAASSDGDGKGATFTVRLPVLAVRAAPDAERRVHPQSDGDLSMQGMPSLKGVRILAVDDEADARELLATILGKCDAEVVVVGSGAEALEALRRWEPDVIISDIGMPVQDGLSLIREVRALEAGRVSRIPAIALTAYARAEDRVRARSAGFQSHVAKPVEPVELAATVASLVAPGREPTRS